MSKLEQMAKTLSQVPESSAEAVNEKFADSLELLGIGYRKGYEDGKAENQPG